MRYFMSLQLKYCQRYGQKWEPVNFTILAFFVYFHSQMQFCLKIFSMLLDISPMVFRLQRHTTPHFKHMSFC